MFEEFEEFDIAVEGATIHGRRGGKGPALLLLHGIPETHLMWHRLAPLLAETFTVVATDLRGYGESSSPPSDEHHTPYAMRALAADQVETMRHLGYETFQVVGHDRGARCAYRMALDHPSSVTRLAVLDIVPTGHAFKQANKDFALGYWVWSFLAAPSPLPEDLIGRAPALFVNHLLDEWSSVPGSFPDDIRQAYIRQFEDPERRRAICEQYRAAGTLDVQHDEQDRGSKMITCPVLTLWSSVGPVEAWYDPIEVWKEWAIDVRGKALSGGHFLAEESPAEVLGELGAFLDPEAKPH